MPRKEYLTDQELNDLHDTVNQRRDGSKYVKVSAEALTHLLFDYGHLMAELHQTKYLERGMPNQMVKLEEGGR